MISALYAKCPFYVVLYAKCLLCVQQMAPGTTPDPYAPEKNWLTKNVTSIRRT